MSQFSNNRTFWLYHCLGIALVFFLQVLAFSQRDFFAFNFSAAVLWLPVFSAAVLLFRYGFKRWKGYQIGLGKLVAIALGYGVVAGFFICLFLLSCLLPFFAEEFWGEATLKQFNTTKMQLLVGFFLGNIFMQTLFISGWIFIYTTASASRRSKEADMQNMQLQSSLREAQLSQLANQLNPHFLFNSLNNIRFVIHENPDHADAMVTALSEILRYSLASGNKTKVTVLQEVEFIKRYIDIVKLQLEERLHYHVTVEDAVKQYLMPPMIMQLLVENAVKHGMDNLPQGGDLIVNVQQQNNTLVICVVNPLPESKANVDGTGTGLINIKHRLNLLYGRKAALDVEETTTHFTVRISLPVEKSDESPDS